MKDPEVYYELMQFLPISSHFPIIRWHIFIAACWQSLRTNQDGCIGMRLAFCDTFDLVGYLHIIHFYHINLTTSVMETCIQSAYILTIGAQTFVIISTVVERRAIGILQVLIRILAATAGKIKCLFLHILSVVVRFLHMYSPP